MPPREVYSVDFTSSNMTPVTTENWGPLVLGGSANGFKSAVPTSRGLQLHMTRDAAQTDPVSNSVVVVPPAGAFPIDSRFRMRVWFETPFAQPLPDAGREPTQLENWAVALSAKLEGSATDLPTDTYFAVTCQFRRVADSNGVRLNGVKELQADQGGYLDSPINYHAYRAGCLGFGRAPQFMLEMNFCGKQSAPIPSGQQTDPPQLGYAVVSGSLSIDDRADHRVLSTNNLTTDSQSHIGSLGVVLATLGGVGQYRVRLRRFAISLW
jgi:hypothetical protein